MNRGNKTKGRLAIATLLVWFVVAFLSGCIVRLDQNIGEQPIPEKPAQMSEVNTEISGTELEEAEPADKKEVEPEGAKEAELTDTKEAGSADAKEAEPTDAKEAEPTDAKETEPSGIETVAYEESLDPNGSYTDKDQVALYLHLYGQLPGNYITKKEAEKLGWDAGKGNLDQVLPGKSIGGSRFGNREELLPKKDGRNYYECDIDYDEGYRGGKRIVYSNDGLIYYTEDHYKTFELLYTDEGKAE